MCCVVEVDVVVVDDGLVVLVVARVDVVVVAPDVTT